MPSKKKKSQAVGIRAGGAPAHAPLVNSNVHVFVDDQNLFWGFVNDDRGHSFRIDFGRLLSAAARSASGQDRGVMGAYIAGVIPDDDSFWKIAERQGFKVRRGFLGSKGRSKQDDAYLITDLTQTLCEQPGPSTIVLVAGDADYVPPLELALRKGWRVEVAFASRGISTALNPVVHEYRTISSTEIEYMPGFR